MKKDEILEKLNSIETRLNKENDIPLNFNQAADYLGLSHSYLYKLTSRKIIPCYRPTGKILFFSKVELNEWVFSQRDGKPKNGNQKSEDRSQNKKEQKDEDEPP